MPGIAFHEQAGITVSATDRTTGVRVQTEVKNLRWIEDALCCSFTDFHIGHFFYIQGVYAFLGRGDSAL